MAGFDDTFQTELASESWCLYSVGISMIMFRIYARASRVGISKLQADDYVMVLAAAWYTVLLGAVNAVAAVGGSNFVTADALAHFSAPDVAARVLGSKMLVLVEQAQLHTLTLLKLSLLLLYVRLPPPPPALPTTPTKPTHQSRLPHTITLLRALAAYLPLAYLVAQTTFLAACRPVSGNWALPPPHPQCATRQAYSAVLAVVDAVGGLGTSALGVVVVRRMNMGLGLSGGGVGGRKELWGLLAWIGVGGLLVTLLTLLPHALALSPTIALPSQPAILSWHSRAASAAIILANAPSIYPLLRDWFPCLRPPKASAWESGDGGELGRWDTGATGVWSQERAAADGGEVRDYIGGRNFGGGGGGRIGGRNTYAMRLAKGWDWERRVYGKGSGSRSGSRRSSVCRRSASGAGSRSRSASRSRVGRGMYRCGSGEGSKGMMLTPVVSIDTREGGGSTSDLDLERGVVEDGVAKEEEEEEEEDGKESLELDTHTDEGTRKRDDDDDDDDDDDEEEEEQLKQGIRKDVLIVVSSASLSDTEAEEEAWVRRVSICGPGG